MIFLGNLPSTKARSLPLVSSLAIANAVQTKLKKLGIYNTFDLLLYFPLRYIDETRITPIRSLQQGQYAQVEGLITDAKVIPGPHRRFLCQLEDNSGALTLVFFNFYPNQTKQLMVGAQIRAMGEVRHQFSKTQMIHPQCRVIKNDTALPQTLTPIYPTTAGLTQNQLRKFIEEAIVKQDLSDTLPLVLLQKLKLPDFATTVKALHYPEPGMAIPLMERSHPAWQRVKFDELLAQQISLRRSYQLRRSYSAPLFAPPGKMVKRLLQSLPFRLTKSQHKAWLEINRDMSAPHPMQRLLQGDVGSGKTIIAALATLQAIENNYQVAIMVPTEILSEQHYRKFSEWLSPLNIHIVWLTSSLKSKEKIKALNDIASGTAQLCIGTHALIQNEVIFHKLGLTIIDEQHRFGVEQRTSLQKKGVRTDKLMRQHQLMMSATPIPRTLAMSYYADLDVSVIDKLPPGRKPVTTKLISEARRDEVIQRIRSACLAGKQAYWICPLIEESEKLQLQTALDTYTKLKQTFPELNIGLVHGRMSQEERAKTMSAFGMGQLPLLVATTVIEVGVDVPNACLMVIEHAERFGLSQLHQLRGRIGRGVDESVCLLLYQNPLTDTARQRLKIIYENTDGFAIARHDLHLRGPGEFIGIRQSGVPLLRFADLNTDQALLEKARQTAQIMLRDYPNHAQYHVQRWLGSKYDTLRS